MSKQVKGLMMAEMRREFAGVADFVVANPIGLNSKDTHDLRVELRKKKIRIRVVRNNLARKVFEEMGVKNLDDVLVGSSAIVWGGTGGVELAREVTEIGKKLAKLELKAVCLSGELLKGKEGVETASKLPSRTELIGQIAAMPIGPAQAVVAALSSPASAVASQIQSIAEKDQAPAS